MIMDMDMDIIGSPYLLAAPGVLGKVAALLAGLVLGLWYFDDAHTDTLKGARVLVTGASRGLGEHVAYSMAAIGAEVTVTARSEAALMQVSQTCSEVSPNNSKHHVVAGDMSNMADARRVVEESIKLMGGLDILVLNHITTTDIQPFTGSMADLGGMDGIMDVNFRSHAYLAAHALPELIANKGRIVVINSLIGRVGHPYLAPYVASKFALDGFFSSLRNQFTAEQTPVSLTMCYLGLIGTDEALAQLRKSGSHRILNNVKPEDPKDAAAAIVRAASARRYQLFYPPSARLMVWLHALCPRAADWVSRVAAVRT